VASQLNPLLGKQKPEKLKIKSKLCGQIPKIDKFCFVQLLVFLVKQFSIWFQGNSQISSFCVHAPLICSLKATATTSHPLENPRSTFALKNHAIFKPLPCAPKIQRDFYINQYLKIVFIVLKTPYPP